MNVKSLFIICVILLGGCKNSNEIKNPTTSQNTFKQNPFEIVEVNKSVFKNKSANRHMYYFTGKIKNTSDNLFESVYVTLEVEFLLKNGNTITKRDYTSSLPVDIGHLIKSWKPNETKILPNKSRDLNSDFIPSFKDYPIEKVYAILTLDAEDLINKKENTYHIKLDISKQWFNKKK
ncbi:hypothetical protein [Mesonia hippocampi]|uniref:hypothetical protein n=1 Tax=Mesonia hippocampi TaxID=1628250 RepID=UPI003F996C11